LWTKYPILELLTKVLYWLVSGKLRNGSLLEAETTRTAREILASRTEVSSEDEVSSELTEESFYSETSDNNIDSPSSDEEF